MTHKAYKTVKKKYRVFARYKDKSLCWSNIKSQKKLIKAALSRGNLRLRLKMIKIILCLGLSKIQDKI